MTPSGGCYLAARRQPPARDDAPADEAEVPQRAREQVAREQRRVHAHDDRARRHRHLDDAQARTSTHARTHARTHVEAV